MSIKSLYGSLIPVLAIVMTFAIVGCTPEPESKPAPAETPEAAEAPAEEAAPAAEEAAPAETPAVDTAEKPADGSAMEGSEAEGSACESKPGCTTKCLDKCLKEGEWKDIFNGTDLTGWQNARDPQAENKWSVEDGAMTNADHGNDIGTVDEYKNFCLQLEYKTIEGGNSGVYLRGRIEVQVLDSYGKEEVTAHDAGAIYDKFAPLVNAAKPAGEWNKLEACYCGDKLTVKLNGQLVQDNTKIVEVTGGALPGGVNDPGPIMLQGDHGKVWYRNIKISEMACCDTCPKADTCPAAEKCEGSGNDEAEKCEGSGTDGAEKCEGSATEEAKEEGSEKEGS